MGLSMRFANGKTYPMLTCDGCGKPIIDLGTSIVVFDWHREDEEFAPVSVYHKVECDPGLPLSDESNHYLHQLVWNHDLGEKSVNDDRDILTIQIEREDIF